MKRFALLLGVSLLVGVGLFASGVFSPSAGDPEPATPASIPAPGEGAALEVRALASPGASGRVAFALFDSEDAFAGKAPPARKEFVDLDAEAGATWRIEGLEPGRYAVKAYHDANGNGELDKGAFGAPIEAYGFSRNARGKLGPPDYAAVGFTLGPADLRLEVRLER